MLCSRQTAEPSKKIRDIVVSICRLRIHQSNWFVAVLCYKFNLEARSLTCLFPILLEKSMMPGCSK